jgi:hypothetical protein
MPSVSSLLSQSLKSATARKSSGKCSHVETSLEASVSENTKLLELAKGSYDFKAASIAAKRQKMELKAKQEHEGQQYAAEERALMIKERMQEKEFEHREQMMKYELKLAQLKAQVPTSPQHAQQPLTSDTLSPGSGGFRHTTQAGIYTTPDNCTFDNFTFPAQCSSVTPSPNSEVWSLGLTIL